MELKNNLPDTSQNKKEKLAISLRLATPEDWETVKDLRIEAITGEDKEMFFGDHPEWAEGDKTKTEKEWKSELLDQKNFTILSYNNDKVVGFGRGWENPKHPGAYYIGHAFTKKEFRGNDAGKKVFASRLREVINRHGKLITHGVWHKNDKMIGISESFGFKKIFDKPNDDGFYAMALSDLDNPVLLKQISEILDTK